MRSVRTDHTLRAAADMYKVYMYWALIVVGISILIRTVLWLLVDDVRTIDATPLTFVRGPGQVFMLVVGIVTGIFAIAHFIRQGVTRRSFLAGAILSGVAVAVSLQIIGFALYGLAAVIEPLLPEAFHVPDLRHTGSAGPAMGTMVDILLTIVFFLMGFCTGFAFYRFGFSGGMVAVVAGIVVLGGLTSLWGEGVEINITGIRIPPIDGPSTPVSLAITLGLTGALVWTLYGMLRNAPLKVR